MKIFVFVLASILLSVPVSAVAEAAGIPMPVDRAREILIQADLARGGETGVEWTVTMLGGKDEDSLKVYRKVKVVSLAYWGLITTLYPEKAEDEQALIYKGTMWLYREGLSRPVPASSRQRTVGQLSYGDLVSTNYSEDYEIVSMEETEADGEALWVFDLKAAKKVVPYQKVRYWVSKDRGLGVKSEFYAVSGLLLKSARMHYETMITEDGDRRPFISEIRIRDHLIKEPNLAVLRFSEPLFREVSEDDLRIKLTPRKSTKQ
jgi:hypothetical protein